MKQVGDDETKSIEWTNTRPKSSKEDTTPTPNKFVLDDNLVFPQYRALKTPYACWKQFFSDEIMERMLQHTNERIKQHLVSEEIIQLLNSDESSSEFDWLRTTDEIEMRAFIGEDQGLL